MWNRKQDNELEGAQARRRIRFGRRVGPFRMVGIGFVLIAAIAVYTIGSNRQRAEAEERTLRIGEIEKGPKVQVATVRSAPLTRRITLPGEVRAFRQTTLYAKVSGYLRDVLVDKGDRVRKGQILGLLDSPETERDAISKEADLTNKRLSEQRLRKLVGSGVVSQEEMDRAEADSRIADAELSRIAVLRGYQTIRAPFDGVITARYADPGALMQAATSSQNALPLVDVADLDRVRIAVYLPQVDAHSVRQGDPVTLWTDDAPNRKVEASVTRFTQELDARTRTMLCEVELDNRGAGFYPGTVLRVGVTVHTEPSLEIPLDAVVMQDGKATVAIVGGDRAHFTPIEPGPTDGQTVRVLSGLHEGEVIVIHPGDDVVEGGAVRVAAR